MVRVREPLDLNSLEFMCMLLLTLSFVKSKVHSNASLQQFQSCMASLYLRFVSQHSHFFTATCTDGSHPLVWTQYHFHYKELFERQLADVLQGFDVLEDDFANFCDWLKVNAEIFEDDTEGLYPFLSSITASLEPCLARRNALKCISFFCVGLL